jgi:hypothetical protein
MLSLMMVLTPDGGVGATGALKSPILVRRNGSSAIPPSSVTFLSRPHRDNVFADAVQPPLKVDVGKEIQPLRNHTFGAPERFKNTHPNISPIARINQYSQRSIALRLAAAIDIAGSDRDTTSHCF